MIDWAMTPADSAALSRFFIPFLLIGALGALAAVRVAVQKWLPNSRLKRILLTDV